MSKEVHNKVIMVNSFKGGTGKTSVALSYCVHNWKMSLAGTEDYSRVFFIDIDRLGTSMSYVLFQEGKKLRYFNEYSPTNYENVCNEVEMPEDRKDCMFYAVLLNPVAALRQDYFVHKRLRQYMESGSVIFEEDLLNFMEKCISDGENNLFVVDCSPGLAEMERNLLGGFYRLRDKERLKVEEIYVTTFDSSQIKKTINCLNADADVLHKEEREVSIVLNDLHNCRGIAGENEDFMFNWKETAEEILEKLKDKGDKGEEDKIKNSLRIRYKQYEEDQLRANIIKNEAYLINNTSLYALQQEYRDEYVSVNRKGK